MTNNHFDTLQVHAGRVISPNGPCTTPIVQTSAFHFDSAAQAANLFSLKEFGNIYTRLSNPTTDVLEQRVAALEGGAAAVATSSGQAAQFLAIQNIAGEGDNIISSSSLYGGTYNQFKISFTRLGIESRFAPVNDSSAFEARIDNRTKAIYIESISNSNFYIPDFEEFEKISKKYGVPIIVDNTFGAGGYLCRPIELGAAIVTHSATKWIGGHGNSLAGIVVDSGKFRWDNGRFPYFTNPSESYHGVSFWESFGEGSATGNIAFAVKARTEGLRDWGCCLSPFNAFLILTGVETLSLRVERVVNNALELAKWLRAHPKVESVNYPGLIDNPNHERAKRYLTNGFGGVLSFAIKGSKEQASQVVTRLTLISHLTNVGDNKTLISHSASTTHSQMTPRELQVAGIGESSLRVSLGIEHIEDIKRDLESAFTAI
ncbi:MAG: aminotransferase class I/II-fold pyridoxal phosphate-dependent enzyme [Bacteroidales bacterium]|nr:aminotransferase class I/II-fold pyridoxal phosphate-dependent enzyme [Bacteroidales bacterium]